MGRGQNGIGKRELKELICTTHGRELSGGKLEGWGAEWRGNKGEKIRETNSIINKIYLKK